MKTSALVLAALLATAGGAFAGDSVADLKFPQTTQATTQEKIVLDHRATGSVKPVLKAQPQLGHTSDRALSKTDKSFGIDVSPWMMPTTY